MGLTIYVSSICSNRIFHSKPSSYLGIPGYVPPWLTNPPNMEWLAPRTLRLFMLLVALDTLLYWLLEWFQPASEVADSFGVVWRVWCWSWMLAKSMKSELLWDTMYLLCTNTVIPMVGLKFDSNAGPDGLGCAILEIQRPRWQCRGTMTWNAKETPELSWYSHRRWSEKVIPLQKTYSAYSKSFSWLQCGGFQILTMSAMMLQILVAWQVHPVQRQLASGRKRCLSPPGIRIIGFAKEQRTNIDKHQSWQSWQNVELDLQFISSNPHIYKISVFECKSNIHLINDDHFMHRRWCRFRTSYWRVARMRLDLRMEIFPKAGWSSWMKAAWFFVIFRSRNLFRPHGASGVGPLW